MLVGVFAGENFPALVEPLDDEDDDAPFKEPPDDEDDDPPFE
jgi:hypothetical protein